MTDGKVMAPRAPAGFLGSLRDALAAASRDDTGRVMAAAASDADPSVAGPASVAASAQQCEPAVPPAAEAVREARGGEPNVPPLARFEVAVAADEGAAPTTRVHRAPVGAVAGRRGAGDERTRILRGRPQASVTAEFAQDPVVGWLVVIAGPGLGAFRPIFEGNNTVGRARGQRIALDFGDDTISAEEQVYIRYDSAERGFLFVPNLAKTNIVSLNGKRPTAAVPLAAMDVIGMGRTQLVFVPFCGPEFDWAELADKATT